MTKVQMLLECVADFRFPCRTATVHDRVFSLDGTRDDATLWQIDNIHHQFGMQLDTSIDNHEAYRVKTMDIYGNTAILYFGFSDFGMCVGKSIEEKGW